MYVNVCILNSFQRSILLSAVRDVMIGVSTQGQESCIISSIARVFKIHDTSRREALAVSPDQIKIERSHRMISNNRRIPNLKIFDARCGEQVIQWHEFRRLPVVFQSLISIAAVHIPGAYHNLVWIITKIDDIPNDDDDDDFCVLTNCDVWRKQFTNYQLASIFQR